MTLILRRPIKKAVRISSGFGLLGCGMILFFTPGPGWVVIMTALGVLAADFLWARRVLSWVRRMMARLRVAVFGPDLSHGGLTQVGHHPFAGHHSGRLFKSHRM